MADIVSRHARTHTLAIMGFLGFPRRHSNNLGLEISMICIKERIAKYHSHNLANKNTPIISDWGPKQCNIKQHRIYQKLKNMDHHLLELGKNCNQNQTSIGHLQRCERRTLSMLVFQFLPCLEDSSLEFALWWSESRIATRFVDGVKLM